jgi:ATP-dependent exoDNAse (exonuclease V) beta subunit
LSVLFSIYRSSAGSGKTRTLAKEYLKLALKSRAGYFKHILGVTFTNKSTQEMKDRIIAYLNDFAEGKQNDLSLELQKELGFDAQSFQNYAADVRGEILHNYSQFSISTIDAFFQKVIRSFTREAGLAGDYRLEVENDPIVQEVVDNLLDELGGDKDLTNWVIRYATEEFENERGWDIRKSLQEFSKQIFRDEYKEIESGIIKKTSNPEFLKKLLDALNEVKYLFINTIKKLAEEAVNLIKKGNYTYDDFKYAGGGAFSYLVKISKIESVNDFNEKEKGKRAEGDYQKSINWPAKDTPHAKNIQKLAEEKLIPLLNEILDFREKHFKTALSAEVALSNFYSFGLISDISRKLKEYKDENNIMLLSDAPYFLHGVIQESDTPFIYEKVGSFYKNFLIDEFQDTSRMQWSNFFPLLTNALDQGDRSLIVGDVKQAIYRWRGGDLSLLQREVEEEITKQRVESKNLSSNFRSARLVVEFNNALFKEASSWVSAETGHALPVEAYTDIAQEISRDDQGFVDVSFIEENEEGEKWNEIALNRVPILLEKLQRMGAQMKDIAILVRRNEEGQQIVAHLLNYKNSENAKQDLSYDVVSNESLRLDSAASVNLLLAALKYLSNADDVIARAQLAYEYSRLNKKESSLSEVFSVANKSTFETNLPEAFTKQKVYLKKLPLFELTETLVQIFDLGKLNGELTYLQTFQDLVLEFSSRERNDLSEFIDWWEENKTKKSIQVSGEVDAAQIFTIHKAKGLQFKYVIIPFCAWELDHSSFNSPTLWVQSDQPPFNGAGYLPIKYSGTLKETLFASYYEEERARSYLDNLNLLYVALTRAEHGLIVMAPHVKNRNHKGKVCEMLFSSMQRSFDSGWSINNDVWISGEWLPKEDGRKVKVETNRIELQKYETSQWREKLVIKQSSKGHFEKAEEGVSEKVKYGIHLHTILSKIKYQNEVEEAIDLMEADGIITNEEKPEIKSLIEELLQDSVIADWFSTEWEVRTEVPILIPGEGDNRIDRLLIKNKKAKVIDFKTGEATKSDQKQVVSYIETLRKMNFTEVNGYLLYIKTGEIISVPQGKKSKVKGKSDAQLGLDF